MANFVSAEDVQRLLEERCVGASEGTRPHCRVAGPRYRSKTSQIFYVECPTFAMPLSVKLCIDAKTGSPDRAEARTQFDALRSVADKMDGNCEFGVAQPIAVLDDEGVLIAEWVVGRSLTDYLLDWRCPMRALRGYVGRAGVWLQRFHRSSAEGEAPIDAVSLIAHLEEAIDAAGAALADEPIVADALRMLTVTAPAVSRRPLPLSRLHGDFKPDNIIIAAERTVGIDIHARFHNQVVRDVTHFINHIHFASFRPSGIRLLPAAGSLIDCFLRAYGGADWALEALPLGWMRLHSVTRIWAESRTGDATGLKTHYQSFRFRHLVTTLTEALGQVGG